MPVQHAVFAVYRDEIFRFHQRVHEFEFLLARVAGDMHVGNAVVNHVRAAAIQLIDDPGNHDFVARNRRRGNDHRVPLANLQFAVLAVGHAGQAAHRFALAARRQHHNFAVRIAVQIANVDEHVLWNFQFADLHRQLGHVDHASTDKADFPPKFDAIIHHLLNSVQIGGEHRDDNPPLRVLKQVVERLTDLLFAHRVAGALHVRGFRQHRQHAAASPRGQRIEIGHFAVDRRVIDLKVARHNHRARRTRQRHRHRARDRMAHLDKLHGKRAGLNHILRLHDMKLDVADIMLRQLAAYERTGQLCAVNRRGYARQHIRRRADMILVAVGEQIGAHALPVAFQIRDIRNHKINAEHIGPRENRAAVHHNDIVAEFKGGHVFADLAQTAQRNDSQLCQLASPPFCLLLLIFIFQKPFFRSQAFQIQTIF